MRGTVISEVYEEVDMAVLDRNMRVVRRTSVPDLSAPIGAVEPSRSRVTHRSITPPLRRLLSSYDVLMLCHIQTLRESGIYHGIEA